MSEHLLFKIILEKSLCLLQKSYLLLEDELIKNSLKQKNLLKINL